MGKFLPCLLLLALLSDGCMTPTRVAALKRRVELLDLNTFETLKFKGPGPYQEHLVLSPFQAQKVCYLFRHRDELKVVFRSLDGSTTEEKTAPLYSLWYILDPALRPDERAIAYFADGTTAVHIYEFATKKNIRITADLAPNHAYIQALRWIDNRYLLVVLADRLESSLDSQGRPVVKRVGKGSLVKVDSETQKISAPLELEYPWNIALSPSGTHVAVTQMVRGSGIKIVDLRPLSIIAEIPGNNSRSWMHTPAWCPDGAKLAYVDGEDWLCVRFLDERRFHETRSAYAT